MSYFVDKYDYASVSEVGVVRDEYGQLVLNIAGQQGFLLISDQEALNLSNCIRNLIYGDVNAVV